MACLFAVDGLKLGNDKDRDFIDGLRYVEDVLDGDEFRTTKESEFFVDRDEGDNNELTTLLSLLWHYVHIPLVEKPSSTSSTWTMCENRVSLVLTSTRRLSRQRVALYQRDPFFHTGLPVGQSGNLPERPVRAVREIPQGSCWMRCTR